MKDSCASVSKLLDKYFDQEVSGKERSLVESHLQGCLSCSDLLKSMDRLRMVIRTPIEEALEREDFPWVWQKIQREIHLRERPNFWETLRSWLALSPFSRRRVWIPAVTAALILILTTGPFLFKKSPSYPDSSVVEYVESETYNVMIYESERKEVTVIWLLEGPEMGNSPS